MKSKRSCLALVGVLALAVSLTMGLTVSGAAAAKKKKKAGGTVNITKAVNQQVPDATATTNGVLVSTIQVGGKKFKGTKVRDVNVTLQATGSAGDAAEHLTARLTAPNGATTWLFANSVLGQSFGPLTFDDESVNTIVTDANDPTDSTLLPPPYAGTVQPHCFSAQGGCTLSAMDNGPVSGTWTLRVVDNDATPPLTSILNSWRLTAVAGKAFQTK
jgi:subtilisin-like proprotein convertase family protein